MKLRALPELSSGAISDIAFLLLIFFVTTTQILDERGIPVTLPRIDAQPAAVPDKDIFHVHINRANEILAEGVRPDIQGFEQQLYDHVATPDMMQGRQVVISLHCDRETSYHRFIEVHDAIRRVYREIWNEASLKVFQKSFSSLSETHKNSIKLRFPLIVSEAEWNR